MKATTKMDLSYYSGRFDDALCERYKQTFSAGFAKIRESYNEVQSGERRLRAADVMSIFSEDLPFGHDWTKPDAKRLADRMDEFRVAEGVYRLRDRSDPGGVLELLTQIRAGFGDLSLTALVLHHVYPARFAMCSHHLASLLYIVNASTVPKFYLDYCDELKLWGREASSRQLDVVETEFALWTWYRLTYYGRNEEKRKHRDNFFSDPWIRDRRAVKIANALKGLGRLDIARSYLRVDVNLAAIIAWVEFERPVRTLLDPKKLNKASDDGMLDFIDKLPVEAIPRSRKELKYLWDRNGRGRNKVIHGGLQLAVHEATEVVDEVAQFLARNSWD